MKKYLLLFGLVVVFVSAGYAQNRPRYSQFFPIIITDLSVGNGLNGQVVAVGSSGTLIYRDIPSFSIATGTVSAGQLLRYDGTDWVNWTPNYLTLTGGTLTGKLITIASNTSGAGFNIPLGTAPTSPVNGDIWTTTDGLFGQINGKTVNFASPYVFESGLTETSGTVKLGGNLTANTEIIQDNAESLTFTNSGTANTIINLTSTGDLDIQDDGKSALFVGDAGNIGIGTSSPMTALHIVRDYDGKSDSGLMPMIQVNNTSTSTNSFSAISASAASATSIDMFADGLGTLASESEPIVGFRVREASVPLVFYTGMTTERMRITAEGNIEIAGDLTVTNNFYNPSDKRLKRNIETLSGVLDKINQMRGVTFEFIDQTKYAAGAQVGVIAQELQAVYPELVMTGRDGFLKVDYTHLTAILLQGIKEQQQQMTVLQKKVQEQEERLDRQQQQIDEIIGALKNK